MLGSCDNAEENGFCHSSLLYSSVVSIHGSFIYEINTAMRLFPLAI